MQFSTDDTRVWWRHPDDGRPGALVEAVDTLRPGVKVARLAPFATLGECERADTLQRTRLDDVYVESPECLAYAIDALRGLCPDVDLVEVLLLNMPRRGPAVAGPRTEVPRDEGVSA